MVMEYASTDLKQLLKTRRQGFSQSEAKMLLTQLLRAVAYLHQNSVIHRDLKTANILLQGSRRLVLCDFGVSHHSPQAANEGPVTSLLYRAPEQLLGAPEYSFEIDQWSVGCIFAELMLQKPLMHGYDERSCFDSMQRVLGTPADYGWPLQARFSKVPPCQGSSLRRLSCATCLKASSQPEKGGRLTRRSVGCAASQ